MPQLLVHLLSATNLIAADSNGSGQWKKSKVIAKTLNPRWNETFILPVGDPQSDTLELRVFDRDILIDDSIGKAAVSLVNLRYGVERELSVTLDGVKSGELSIILTALDFGEKKEEEPAAATKSPRHLPLPAGMSNSKLPVAPTPPHTKSASSPPSHQPELPPAPVHAVSAPAIAPGSPAPQSATAQPPSPPKAASPPAGPPAQPVAYPPHPAYAYPPPPMGQAPAPYPPPGAYPPQPAYAYPPPPQPYYPAPYAYGFPPAPGGPPQPVQQPPSPATASLADLDKVKKQPVAEVYDLGKQLGKGAFAVVFEATRKSDKEMVAVKVIEKARVAGANVKLLRREVVNLMALSHPNIMRLHEVYEDQDKFYLILELIRGKELFDKIVALGHYSERDAAHIMEQVFSAISYLHSKGIAHRDLKPENLMSIGSGADESIKLADFGLSKNFSEEEMSTSCGSPLYVAPEVLIGRGYTKAVDMWSLGVILYILLVGYPPFNGANVVQIYRQILHNEWGFGPAWSVISAEARDLVLRLMCYDPARRATADEAMQHPWIKQKASLSQSPLALQSELAKTMAQLNQM